MIPHLRDVKVPTLNVAGWWDQEDFYGPLRIYEALEKHDTQRLNYLVVGPWNHGGWARRPGRSRSAPIAFGSATGKYFRDEVQAPWFAHFLKDKGKLDLPEALTFEAGSNRWRRWDAWPPTRSTDDAPRSTSARTDALVRAARRRRRATAFDELRLRSRRTRSRTAIGRSSRPTSPAARSGRPGWSRTSGSSTTAPTC